MVLIFKHVPFEGPGLIGEMLEGRGIPFKEIDTWADEGFPLTPAGATGIIFMGGPMSVNDGIEVIEKEKEFISQSINRDLPILGVCLGAQLVASALGANVYPGETVEVGWGEIKLTGEGMKDPVVGGVEKYIPVLHWHQETFDMPDDTVLLASSDTCINQAFRYKDNVYGLQFHLEANSEMVEEWLFEDDDENGLVMDSKEILYDMPEWVPRTQFWGSLVFGRFIDRMLRK